MDAIKNFLARELDIDTDELTVGQAVWMGALALMGVAVAVSFFIYSVGFQVKLLVSYVGAGNIWMCVALAIGTYLGMAIIMRMTYQSPMARLTARANKNMAQQAKNGMQAK